jgi:MFS family permease
MLPKKNKVDSNMSATARGQLSTGWVAVIAGAFVVFIAGNFQYSFGVLVNPLINRFGWLRASISGTVTTRSITSSLVSPLVGILSDRYGYRKFILAGIFLVGIGYLLTSRITSLWQLYLFLGAVVGIGIPAFFVPIVSIATKWFGSKSGLANGIITSGFGWAQIVTPPVATYLILQYSWEISLIVLGTAALALGTVAWYFIRAPENTGNEPPAEPTGIDSQKATPPGAEGNYTLSEALRTPAFWILFLVLMTSSASFQMVVIHIVIAAIDTGITPEDAALILTLSGITNTAGRLTLGGLATKIGNKTGLLLSLALQALALFFLAGAIDIRAFYILAAVHGLGYGGVTPLIPTLIGSFFGTRSIGSVFGALITAYTIGGAFGPLLGGYVFDVTGSYYTAFLVAAIVMAATFLFCMLLKPPQRKAPVVQQYQ